MDAKKKCALFLWFENFSKKDFSMFALWVVQIFFQKKTFRKILKFQKRCTFFSLQPINQRLADESFRLFRWPTLWLQVPMILTIKNLLPGSISRIQWQCNLDLDYFGLATFLGWEFWPQVTPLFYLRKSLLVRLIYRERSKK